MGAKGPTTLNGRSRPIQTDQRLRRPESLVDFRLFGDARFAALAASAVLVTALLAGRYWFG